MASFRGSNAEVLFRIAEMQLRRSLYEGFDARRVDQYIGFLRKLWDEG